MAVTTRRITSGAINPRKKQKATTTVSGQVDIPDNDIAYMQHGLTLGGRNSSRSFSSVREY